MLDDDVLRNAFTATVVERVEEQGEGAHRLECQRLIERAARRRLIGMRCSAQRIERGMLGADEHRCGHGLQRIGGAYTFDQGQQLFDRCRVNRFVRIWLDDAEQLRKKPRGHARVRNAKDFGQRARLDGQRDLITRSLGPLDL